MINLKEDGINTQVLIMSGGAASSYDEICKNYNESLNKDNLKDCPEYWGGFSFVPYYFEFWQGHASRINKREVYELKNNDWDHYILQP